MKPKTNYIPPDQFQLLLDNVGKLNSRKLKPIDIKMLFKITRYCGLRISEACMIKVEDIDTELFEITLPKTKTSWKYCKCAVTEAVQSFRVKRKRLVRWNKKCTICGGTAKIYILVKVSIPKQFVKELEKYIRYKKGLLFHTNRFTVNDWLTKLGKMLNIVALTTPQSETGEKTKCHIYRKSIGKDMLYQKIPLNVIMSKLRHKDLGTTSQYLKLNLEDVKQAESNFKI